MHLLKKHSPSLAVFLLIIALIQVVGSICTLSSVKSWYPLLVKPSWNPPAFVFAPVWTALYLMIAIAGWRIFIKKGEHKKKKTALFLYGLQLFFNFAWSYLFFYLKSPLLGMVDIFLILIFLYLTIRAFYHLDKIAAYLLIPYLLWTVYAMTLNVALWRLN